MPDKSSLNNATQLEFEEKVADFDRQIDELRKLSSVKGIDYSSEIRQLQRQQVAELKRVYSNLTAWQTVQVARHPNRPLLSDYLSLMVKDFRELHGDRCFGDDRAIITGLGQIGRERVLVIGQDKGKTTKQKIASNFGCPNPEGYRKALAKMKFAEKFGIPIVTLIDTPGAYPGVGAEERGQAEAIAVNLEVMASLGVPSISAVIGEGGSGGALALGVTNRIVMLEHATYSVISPESCSSILYRDPTKAQKSADSLRLTAKDLAGFGIIDEVVREAPGGAHRDPALTAENLRQALRRHLGELKKLTPELLVRQRYQKFRAMGVFTHEE